LSSLNHFTVPVAIWLPSGVLCTANAEVLEGDDCDNAWHCFGRAVARPVWEA
jgi:hypothetical protein